MAQGNSQRANTQPAHARVVYIAPEAIKEPEMVSLELFFKDTLQSDSFFNANFANYSLPKKQLNYNDDSGYKAQELKQKYSRSWFFIVVGIILILLLFIKFNFSKLYKNALRSFYQRSATAEVINDKYSPRWLFVLFSNLFFVLVISLWVCRNFIRLEAPLYEERLDQFFWIFLIILIVYIGKFLVHLLAGMLFQITESVIIYILNISITHLLCGIVMFFVTLLLMYSPWHGQQWLINVSFAIIIIFNFRLW